MLSVKQQIDYSHLKMLFDLRKNYSPGDMHIVDCSIW